MFNSQERQDEFLEKNVFKGFKNGVFIDVGAHDGVHINNTLYFEKYNNWSGINIEPIKSVYDRLVVNRPKAINLNCAVCNSDGTAEFVINSGYTEMLSGLKNQYDPRHHIRRERENKVYGSTTEIIDVPTKKLETICDENNITHIHYLSIDVEGAEFEVIKSINFDKVFVDIIEFENNYNDKSIEIVAYLKSKNYSVIHRSMDIFMKHQDSQFK
jgi:FkbM family methyltransferase